MSIKKIRGIYYTLLTIGFIGMFAPITVLIIKNWNKYFAQNKSAISVGMGGILAILMVVLLLKFGIKKFAPIFWVGLLWGVVYLLNSIIVDLFPLTTALAIGVVWWTLFSVPIKHYRNLKDAYINENVRTISREETKQKISSGRV